MYFLKRLVTWWNSQTLGTQLFTWRRGEKVGEDAQGNVYYQTRGRRAALGDLQRRDGSLARGARLARLAAFHLGSAADHGAACRTRPGKSRISQNLTGTTAAYAPPGSIRRSDPVARRDYEAWQPE